MDGWHAWSLLASARAFVAPERLDMYFQIE
jgi:hypothetical protein